MPSIVEFGSFVAGTDFTVTVGLAPPTGTSGQTWQFQLGTRFGWSSGLVTKSCASGYNNVSGVNLIDGINGTFNVALNAVDTSGFDPLNYACNFRRLDSGSVGTALEGYLQITI